MVLETASGVATLELVTSNGNMMKVDPVTGAIRSNEPLPSLPQAIDETEFIVAQGHALGNERLHR